MSPDSGPLLKFVWCAGIRAQFCARNLGSKLARNPAHGRRVSKNSGAALRRIWTPVSRPTAQAHCDQRNVKFRRLIGANANARVGASTRGSALNRLGTQRRRGQVENVETQCARLLDPLQQTFQSSGVGSPHRATLSDQRIEFQTSTLFFFLARRPTLRNATPVPKIGPPGGLKTTPIFRRRSCRIQFILREGYSLEAFRYALSVSLRGL